MFSDKNEIAFPIHGKEPKYVDIKEAFNKIKSGSLAFLIMHNTYALSVYYHLCFETNHILRERRRTEILKQVTRLSEAKKENK